MGLKNKKGLIFNIQRYSVHDGPGIRTTVFMKGCPLRCLWCSNPESQSRDNEVIHRDSLCNSCERCIEVCEPQAITLVDGGVRINRDSCTVCGKCVEVCYTGALAFAAQYMSIEEVLEEVEKDALFYRNSNGGVTIGGGEPLAQADFVSGLLKACHDKGLHTALDTCGYASTQRLERVLREVDLVLYDLKHMDPLRHRETTGVSNNLILRNAKTIARLEIPMVISILIIPTISDTVDNLRATADFITKLRGVKEIRLLPYHRAGLGKYRNLDRAYCLEGIEAPQEEDLHRAKEIIESYGLECQIGG